MRGPFSHKAPGRIPRPRQHPDRSEPLNSTAFTALFVVALAASLAVRVWLSRRQVAHVLAHRDAVPTAFAHSVGLAAHQKAADYTVAKQRLGTLNTLIDAALLLLMTLGGGLALLIGWTETIDVSPLWRDVLLFALTGILYGIVGLPFSWWQTFRIEERFGFNRMTLRLWLTDMAKGLAVAVALGLPLLVLVLWLMRTAGATWWLWAWGAWMTFQILILVLYPTLIAPLFNKFAPLQEGELKTQLEALARQCGFAASGVFVVDGSKRSAHSNAYFAGLGRSRRIVLFDTLIAQLSVAELAAVLAHEIGHYKRKHILKMALLSSALTLLAAYLLSVLLYWDPLYQAFWMGTSVGNEPKGLIVLALIAAHFTFWLEPLVVRLSRKHEYEADEYAAAQAGAAPVETALLKIYAENLSTPLPHPLYSACHYSHPTPVERIEAIRRKCEQSKGL